MAHSIIGIILKTLLDFNLQIYFSSFVSLICCQALKRPCVSLHKGKFVVLLLLLLLLVVGLLLFFLTPFSFASAKRPKN